MPYDLDSDPYMTAGAKKLARKQRKEPWGKVLVELGMEPYHTESSARRVAEHAASVQEKLDAAKGVISDLVKCVDTLMPGVGKIALCGEEIMHLNDTLIRARREIQ